MDLICYLHPGWRPLIRPASARRDWMDQTSESFAYRCLPLNIANAHGWELLNPCAFDACWNGGTDTGAVTIRPQGEPPAEGLPTSLFGQGIITFHVPGIFRTPPGWNLWIGGSPNQPKDGIYPLTGVVETDWSPFTFTMNWRFTRPDHWIHFAAGEAICFLFPVQRALLDDVRPVLAPIEAEPGLLDRFRQWSKGRDQFVLRMVETPPDAAADKWQKHYYRGVDMSEQQQIDDHRPNFGSNRSMCRRCAGQWKHPVRPMRKQADPALLKQRQHLRCRQRRWRRFPNRAHLPGRFSICASANGCSKPWNGNAACRHAISISNGARTSAATNFWTAIMRPIVRSS
jgi:hypothetical protein